MKKYFLVFSVISTMLFAACNGSKTGDGVGKTGQNSGTTHSDNNLKYASERETVRAVKIDGNIYYETDEDTDISKRDSNPSGSFTKGATGFELPWLNNESNFADGVYYSGLTSDSIRIPIGDDYEFFKKIADNENNEITNYKYIMRVEGRTQYSNYEEEYIVLTNDINMTASDVADIYYNPDSAAQTNIYIVSALADD